jgi:hypothetical protein
LIYFVTVHGSLPKVGRDGKKESWGMKAYKNSSGNRKKPKETDEKCFVKSVEILLMIMCSFVLIAAIN